MDEPEIWILFAGLTEPNKMRVYPNASVEDRARLYAEVYTEHIYFVWEK